MSMTRDEFRSAVQRHGYRLTDFADDFGVTYDTVRRWGNGYGVPRWAIRVLALMDQHGRAHVEGPKPAKSAGKPAIFAGTNSGPMVTLMACQPSPLKPPKPS